MKYLRDTHILSDARAQRSHSLMTWLKSMLIEDLAISVITVFELEKGVRRLERKDPAGAAPLRRWLDGEVRVLFASRVLPVDEQVALAAAPLHVPDPIPELDALVAATALVQNLTLVTRNVKDFAGTGVRLLNPWESAD
ncbi:MAG: type II toxin-antitoxin system VapC family toxin [Actinobacteria bacterium]|nr:type II toxin-antitoxin system VapC family toxin [Actinomycetota bacterium]